jgi:hypothetical protein
MAKTWGVCVCVCVSSASMRFRKSFLNTRCSNASHQGNYILCTSIQTTDIYETISIGNCEHISTTMRRVCIGMYIDIILTCVYAETQFGCDAASSRPCILHYITVEQTRNSRNNFNHFCVCSNDVTVHRRLPVVLRRPVEVTSGIIRALFDIGDQVFIKIQYNIQRTC